MPGATDKCCPSVWKPALIQALAAVRCEGEGSGKVLPVRSCMATWIAEGEYNLTLAGDIFLGSKGGLNFFFVLSF